MLAAMLGFAALDGLRKALSADVPISIIVVSRYLTFFVLVLLWLRRDGRRLLRSGHVGLQLLRSTVMVVEAALFVYALRYASLADASAAFALAPVAGVLLAILILGERAQGATWLALALSLAGILIMLRPSAHSRPLGIWLALLSAVLYALYGVLTRRVSDLDNARTSFAYGSSIPPPAHRGRPPALPDPCRAAEGRRRRPPRSAPVVPIPARRPHRRIWSTIVRSLSRHSTRTVRTNLSA